MPVASVHLTAEDGGTLATNDLHLGFQFVVSVGYTTENLISLLFLADKHCHKLYPLSLSERVKFLISKMRHKSDSRLLDSVISTTLKRRYKDDIGRCRHHKFGVEITLYAYLHYLTLLHPLEYVLVIEILRARDSLYHIVGIEDGEVGELEHGHEDSALYRHFNPCISLGDVCCFYPLAH